MTDLSHFGRRDALKALLAISATGALAACKDGSASEGEAKAKPSRKAAAKLNASQMATLGDSECYHSHDRHAGRDRSRCAQRGCRPIRKLG